MVVERIKTNEMMIRFTLALVIYIMRLLLPDHSKEVFKEVRASMAYPKNLDFEKELKEFERLV